MGNGGHLCQRDWIWVAYNHHQSSNFGASSRSSISLMVIVEECWVGPKPTTFIWQVIISMDMAPRHLRSSYLLPGRIPSLVWGPVPPSTSVEFGVVGLFVRCWQYPQTQVRVLAAESWCLLVGLDLLWLRSLPWWLWPQVLVASHLSLVLHLSLKLCDSDYGVEWIQPALRTWKELLTLNWRVPLPQILWHQWMW